MKGDTEMRAVKTFAAMAFALLLSLFVLATPAQAQQPHYGHALSNLRQARALLDQDTRPGFREEKDRAIDEIERAIREVKEAMHEEGRDTHFTPPPATGGDPERPMRSALTLLDEAADDMTRGEAPPGLREMQERTLRHINEARRALNHALHQVERHY
jgi:hypothetical protein